MKHSESELCQIGRHQRAVLQLVLVSIFVDVAILLPFPPALANAAGFLVLPILLTIGIVGAVLIYKLAKALGSSVPWLWAIAAFIPAVNLLSLLILNCRATAALRAAGTHVGIMGAKTGNTEADLRAARRTRLIFGGGLLLLVILIFASIFTVRRHIHALVQIEHNLMVIHGAKEHWALMNSKASSSHPSPEDLAPLMQGGRFIEPVAGETYLINSLGAAPTALLNDGSGLVITNRHQPSNRAERPSQ